MTLTNKLAHATNYSVSGLAAVGVVTVGMENANDLVQYISEHQDEIQEVTGLVGYAMATHGTWGIMLTLSGLAGGYIAHKVHATGERIIKYELFKNPEKTAEVYDPDREIGPR